MIARIPKKSASPIDLLDYLHGRGPHGRSTGRGRLIETNLAGSKGTRRERTLWAKQIEAVAALPPSARSGGSGTCLRGRGRGRADHAGGAGLRGQRAWRRPPMRSVVVPALSAAAAGTEVRRPG